MFHVNIYCLKQLLSRYVSFVSSIGVKLRINICQYILYMGFRINLQINVGNFKVTARLDLVFYCCNVLSKFIPLETSTSISVCQCFVDYCLVGSINYTTRVFLQIVTTI